MAVSGGIEGRLNILKRGVPGDKAARVQLRGGLPERNELVKVRMVGTELSLTQEEAGSNHARDGMERARSGKLTVIRLVGKGRIYCLCPCDQERSSKDGWCVNEERTE